MFPFVFPISRRVLFPASQCPARKYLLRLRIFEARCPPFGQSVSGSFFSPPPFFFCQRVTLVYREQSAPFFGLPGTFCSRVTAQSLFSCSSGFSSPKSFMGTPHCVSLCYHLLLTELYAEIILSTPRVNSTLPASFPLGCRSVTLT